MDSVDILKAMADDPQVVHEVLVGLGHGMLDEWDCGLEDALEMFGSKEWALAARSGWSYIKDLKSTVEGIEYLKITIT